MSKAALAWVGWVLISAPPASADKVGRLRAEVDDLAERVVSQRRQARDTLAGLRAERAELERQLRLEQVRATTLARIEAEHRAHTDGLEGDSQARLAPIRKALDAAEAYVDRTLPFQRQARKKALARIRSDLAALHPDPSRALSRLWRFVEEEEALAREVGLSQQPIRLNGARQLVDVARIGMAALYFRTAEDEFGWARRTGDGWTFELVSQEDLRSSIEDVFEAFDDNRALGPRLLALPKSSKRGTP